MSSNHYSAVLPGHRPLSLAETINARNRVIERYINAEIRKDLEWEIRYGVLKDLTKSPK